MKTSASSLRPFASIVASISFIFIIAFANGCKKEEGSTPNKGIELPEATISTTLFIRVVDGEGNSIENADVKVGATQGTTNELGVLMLSNLEVPKSRAYITATKRGFFEASRAEVPKAGEITYAEVVLVAPQKVFSISTTQANTLSIPNSATISLPGSAFQRADGAAYAGAMQVQVTHLDPSAENFNSMIPGGDLLADNAAGARQSLYSFGMLMVKMTDAAGQELQLAPGKTATISMRAPADAPATIPLWHYNQATGIWKEEGSATLANGYYVGTVSHFSIWNYDWPVNTASIEGRIVDCENRGVPWQICTLEGAQRSFATDPNGYFDIRVPAGIKFKLKFSSAENQTEQSVELGPFLDRSTNKLPNSSVKCAPKVIFSINCSSKSALGYAYLENDRQPIIIPINGNGHYSIKKKNFATLSRLVFINQITGFAFSMPINSSDVRGDTINVGTIDPCLSPEILSNANQFTIDGDSNSNASFNLAYTSANSGSARLSPSDSTGTIFINSNLGSIKIGLTNYSGQGGQNGNLGYFEVGIKARNIVYSSANYRPTIRITELGPVGGRIKGTFSGQVSRTVVRNGISTIYTATVSNATFEVPRGLDK